jgi:hypothetical protein
MEKNCEAVFGSVFTWDSFFLKCESSGQAFLSLKIKKTAYVFVTLREYNGPRPREDT